MSSILIRRANMVCGGSSPTPGRLPAGYTELAYLESTGTQYIMTSYRRTSGNAYKMVVDVLPSDYTSNGLFSIGADYIGYFVSALDNDQIAFSHSSQFPSSGRTVLTLDVASDGKNSTLTDGVSTISNTRSSANYTKTPMLFGVNATTLGRCRFYSAKFYANNVLAFDLVPAMRDSDSVVGMYDLVSDTFLTNAGSGTFSYGTL